tara:strand:- start:1872 stop:2873 length:1002 start_codon:yes stop_codon:yes gene_type:complete
MLGTKFYNQSIRKVLIAFGSLFNNINIDRTDDSGDTETIKVPLSYAPRARFVQRLAQEGQSDIEVQTTLPRMAFEWTDLSFDSTRKLNTMHRTVATVSGDNTKMSYRYERVPYNLTIGLAIVARTTEDGLKIIEQILPFFTPEFTVTISDVIKTDVPIVLTSVTQDDTWEGGFPEERRLITWSLDFELKLYLYGPQRDSEIIRKAITQIYSDMNSPYADMVMKVGGSGDFSTAELVFQGTDFASATGVAKVTSWTSGTRVLRISHITGEFKNNVRIIGESSFANWIQESYSTLFEDPTSTNMVLSAARMIVVPNPTDADPDDDYTYTTTISEL